MKLGVLGPIGTFGELAAIKYCEKSNYEDEIVFFDSHIDIVQAFLNKEINQGVLAVENMINGTVREVLDLIYENDISIKHEIILPIHLCLASLKESEEIKTILSHPVALNQIKNYVKINYPSIKLHPWESTASSMKEIIDKKLKNTAAVGPIYAAKKYNLKIIDIKIEDFKNNKTKFYVISEKDCAHDKNENFKTFIAIRNESDFPGLLYSLLEPFAKEKINLTKIESRPTKRKLGNYIFFIEFIGHRHEEKINKVLTDLKTKVTNLKVLGSYLSTTVK